MRRCDRNRKRSKRRGIFCPKHHCYLDSTSKKYPLFADQAQQLIKRGLSQQRAEIIIDTYTTVSLDGEWLEEFWCPECQHKTWYQVHYQDKQYSLKRAPQELWQQVSGVVDPVGNPSVSAFTRNAARRNDYQCSGFRKSIRWAG
jgi:hypothetical protein